MANESMEPLSVGRGAQGELFVVELDDLFAPRRVADKPNLFVGSAGDVKARFERLRSGVGRPRSLAGHVVQLRPDLVVHGMSKDRLKKRLSNAGYNVKGMTDHVWRVYVIELDPARLSAKIAGLDVEGWLYVGQTSKSPEHRFQEHVSGARSKNGKTSLSSAVPRKAGVRLRPDLAPATPFFSLNNSKYQEQRCADELRLAGYWVRSN